MRFEPTTIDGAWTVTLERREDQRGWFARTFCEDEFAAAGLEIEFVQQSLARSERRGTLRGLHLQLEPYAESKYVRCVRGRIFDAIVDLRRTSTTFLQTFVTHLDAEDGRALYVPRGCAHGYQTIVDGTDVLYAMTARYAADFARTIRWDDPDLAIEWPLADPILSQTDRVAPLLAEFLAQTVPL